MAMSLFLLVPDRYVKGKGTWGKKELSEHILLGVIYTPRDYFCFFLHSQCQFSFPYLEQIKKDHIMVLLLFVLMVIWLPKSS